MLLVPGRWPSSTVKGVYNYLNHLKNMSLAALLGISQEGETARGECLGEFARCFRAIPPLHYILAAVGMVGGGDTTAVRPIRLASV